MTRQEQQFWMSPVQRPVEQLLERREQADNGVSGSCTDILAQREALWTLVTHEGVEPTNRHGELELRYPFTPRFFLCEEGDRQADPIVI